jgi:hypothetical protein
VRVYQDTAQIDDSDDSIVRRYDHPKWGNVVDYGLLVDTNELHFIFNVGEKTLLEAAFWYKGDSIFGNTSLILLFGRVIPKLDPKVGYLPSIEGIFFDKTVRSDKSPDTWVTPYIRPFIMTAGYIHYFPLFVLGQILPLCTKMDNIEVDKDGNYIVRAGSLTWTIPQIRGDIQKNGIIITKGTTNYNLGLLTPSLGNLTVLPSGSKLIGVYTARNGEVLTITENEMTTTQLKSTFSLGGRDDCAIGYAGADTVVMIYYPLVIVHFKAFAYDENFDPMEDRFEGYLAAGHEWPPLPTGGGGGGGGGGSSGLLFGLVGLMALAFMAK